jgi:hypothetical protein
MGIQYNVVNHSLRILGHDNGNEDQGKCEGKNRGGVASKYLFTWDKEIPI